jgi:hypothetical protein
MKRVALSVPEIALIGGTRAAFGAGVALLLADRLSDDQRRGAGWALLAIGAVSTVPIVAQIIGAEDASRRGRLRRGRRQSVESQFARPEYAQ